MGIHRTSDVKLMPWCGTIASHRLCDRLTQSMKLHQSAAAWALRGATYPPPAPHRRSDGPAWHKNPHATCPTALLLSHNYRNCWHSALFWWHDHLWQWLFNTRCDSDSMLVNSFCSLYWPKVQVQFTSSWQVTFHEPWIWNIFNSSRFHFRNESINKEYS